MSTQSYPWLKMPHRDYMISVSYMTLKPIERLAFLELAMYAHTQPNNALPNDDKFLSAYARVSIKQWLKIKANVFTEWSLVDGFWMLPNWFVVESAPTNQQKEEKQQPPKKAKSNAERQADYKARQKGNGDSNAKVTDGNATGNEEVTTVNGKGNGQGNGQGNESNADFVTFGGIKGGDLDLNLEQDLDLDQELKTKTTREASECDARFDEFWTQYPRKENKQGAIKAFKKLKPSEKLFEEILLALSKQKIWPAFQNGYAPHAATWLNAKRWEDQAPINQTTSKPVTGVFNGEESDLMRANRAAMAQAKKMLFGEEAA